MVFQTAGVHKDFFAHRATVRCFSCMRTNVFFDVTFPVKPLQTNPTFKGLFASVGSLVLPKMTFDSKGLFALGTLEWFVAGML